MAKKKVVPIERDAEFYFKVGMKYANKKSSVNALKYFRKAVAIEPYNADYQFNLACILVELKQVEKANEILIGILANIDPTLTECYFGIGCNYFDMSDLKKAKEYIEKYIYFAPDGQFIEEAYDILYYLQIYYDMEIGKKSAKSVARTEEECNRLMENCEYKKACAKLEKLILIRPESISVRNDLSVAYFFTGDTEKAISLAKSVLKLKTDEMTAMCNLALFYSLLKKEDLYNKQKDAVCALKPETRSEIYRIAETFIQLGEHEKLSLKLNEYLKDEKQPFLLHLMAVGLFNSRKFDEALNAWHKLCVIFPQYKIISAFYIKETKNVMSERNSFKELSYTERLPQQIQIKFLKKVHEFLNLAEPDFRKKWNVNHSFREIVLYFLYEGDTETKKSIVQHLLGIKKIEVKALLKNVLYEETTEGEIKIAIMDGLGIKNDSKDDLSGFGVILKAEKSEDRETKEQWNKERESVINCALQKMETNYNETYVHDLKKLWHNLVKKGHSTEAPVIKKHEVWAAALEYIYCRLNLIGVTKTKIARKYNISPNSLTLKLKELNK